MIMYNKIISAVSKAIWNTDLITSRVILGLAELFWAILLLWPGNTIQTAMHANMSVLFGGYFWGIIFLISAVCQYSIVITNKLHSTPARYFAFWNMGLWAYSVLSIVTLTYPPPTAIGGEIALAVAAFWIWIRPYILIEGYRRAAYH
jgi:hypothetical protein